MTFSTIIDAVGIWLDARSFFVGFEFVEAKLGLNS
jgi:hypothetical protein